MFPEGSMISHLVNLINIYALADAIPKHCSVKHPSPTVTPINLNNRNILSVHRHFGQDRQHFA
jgi:hypothetical protein